MWACVPGCSTYTAYAKAPNPEQPSPRRCVGSERRNSYEVYLTYMFVVFTGFESLKNMHGSAASQPLWFIGILALSGILGYAVARWYSEPLNRVLRRTGGSHRVTHET